MYAIRRHRRRLLFPPGLLALGFLLLLGCWVINNNAEAWKPHSVLRLTMPRLVQDKAPVKHITFAFSPPYNSAAELELFRPWQTVTFTGIIWQDYFAYNEARILLQQLHDTPNRNRGVRVRFADHATYARVVQVLDLVENLELKRYWLDIFLKPTALYAFTTKPRPSAYTGPLLICGTRNYSPPAPVQPSSFWSQPGYYLGQLFSPTTQQALYSPDWRNPLYLLLLLILASCGQLLRQWRRA